MEALFQRFMPTMYTAFLNFLSFQLLAQEPSELLGSLQFMLPSDVTVEDCPWFFKMHFLLLLPQSTCQQCLGQDFKSLNKLIGHPALLLA